MSKIDYVLLSEPLFLGKKNHGNKVFPKPDVQIEYNEEADHVLICHNGQRARIKHYSAIVENMESKPAPREVTQVKRGRPPIKAQVGGPTDHVFSEGPGKTRD